MEMPKAAWDLFIHIKPDNRCDLFLLNFQDAHLWSAAKSTPFPDPDEKLC